MQFIKSDEKVLVSHNKDNEEERLLLELFFGFEDPKYISVGEFCDMMARTSYHITELGMRDLFVISWIDLNRVLFDAYPEDEIRETLISRGNEPEATDGFIANIHSLIEKSKELSQTALSDAL